MAASAMPKDPLSGRLGHLSPEQVDILAKFKKELETAGIYEPGKGPPVAELHGGGLQDASHSDATLLRFLRARKFDLPKAVLMFTNSEKWRKDFKVDELYNTFEYPQKKEVDAIYPQFYHKIDKDGRPVYIEQLGKLDLTKLYKITTQKLQIERLVVEYEKFLRDRLSVCSVEKGELIETSCTVMDLANVGLRDFWNVSTYIQEASEISQNYYPETMGKFYIINAPFLFSGVWTLVKPWLDEVTVKKIEILGTSYQPTLLAQIDAEHLPKVLGGKCQCAEGCSLSDAGPWQDEAAVRKMRASRDVGGRD